MPAGADDLYAILGVGPSATQEQLRAAFRARAKGLHPDVNPGHDAEGAFRSLREAYAVLTDPAMRAEYDRRRARPLEQPQPARTAQAARGVGHYSWTNIADRGQSAARAVSDPVRDFDELYRTFFEAAARARASERGRADRADRAV
ncbi:MAG: hypothetical protein C0475_06995 [Planctomyces sp.]|nr:hypothetical protein [Planctomyces sp.]